jgi:hypothetical protein
MKPTVRAVRARIHAENGSVLQTRPRTLPSQSIPIHHIVIIVRNPSYWNSFHKYDLNQGCTFFKKIRKHLRILGVRMGHMKQVPHWGTTNNGGRGAKDLCTPDRNMRMGYPRYVMHERRLIFGWGLKVMWVQRCKVDRLRMRRALC